MELPLESLISFQPRTGTDAQWNAAYRRVEDYLRAHRIHNRLHQSRLILRALVRAARRHEKEPQIEPITLAVEEIDKMMDDWFAALLDEKDVPHQRIAVEGRLALWLCDGTQRWPYAFLDEEHVPQEFSLAMKRSSIQAGPDLAISNMVPRDIDLGTISDVAGQTLARIERLPILRVTLLWGILLAALFVVFQLTR